MNQLSSSDVCLNAVANIAHAISQFRKTRLKARVEMFQTFLTEGKKVERKRKALIKLAQEKELRISKNRDIPLLLVAMATKEMKISRETRSQYAAVLRLMLKEKVEITSVRSFLKENGGVKGCAKKAQSLCPNPNRAKNVKNKSTRKSTILQKIPKKEGYYLVCCCVGKDMEIDIIGRRKLSDSAIEKLQKQRLVTFRLS